jgi:alanine racemase
MHYSINQIAAILNAQLLQENTSANNEQSIEHLLIDSRKIIFPESSVFIAIKGDRNDGHAYIQDVYDAGVRNFIVEKQFVETYNYETHNYTSLLNANIIVVPNTLDAMQQLAAHHRLQYQIPVIGITGSNGKTIVKEWLYQILKDKHHIARNPKSYNSQVGVPLSIWQINKHHQLGIFEAGISQPNEMQKLANIIKPDIGIFTMIGNAHDKGFLDQSKKIKEKLNLFNEVKIIIYGEEQELLNNELLLFKKKNTHIKTTSWSRKNKSADIYFTCQTVGLKTKLFYAKTGTSVEIPFADEASIWNACTCLAYLISSETTFDENIIKAFSELQSVEMRLQLKEAQNNCVVINDGYNSDLNSLGIALDFMQQQSAGITKTLILSDILETGRNPDELYNDVAKLLEQKNISKLIGIGEELLKHAALFKQTKFFYPSTNDFLKAVHSIDFNHEIILLKGARKFEFEKISKLLEKRIHETVFEINLNALVNNLNVYRALLKPKVKLMAMVKAFSYGTGSYEIAKVLEFNRVDYLTVAYADEGVTLRKAGIKAPIMVMNPEVSSFDTIIKHNLEPEIYNFSILNELLKASNEESIGIHIELDSGMKRLGFDEEQLEELLNILWQRPNLYVKSIFTHLAASEANEHDEFTKNQMATFERMANKMSRTFPYPILKHCLNSGGIVRFPDAQFDMVRLGIGLYGIDPAEEVQKQLHQIGTLKTVISQIRNISKDESIGYGRKGRVDRASRIAITAIGYADGLNRKLSNGNGYMLVNGKPAPIVGNICMDMTMIDVTDIECKEGDEVIIFGAELNISDVAKKVGTIPYEILTSISQRVKRVYFYE